MSNILIIKHGSLGDIIQISGVLKDLRENYKDKKIFILTTKPYTDLLNNCPYIDEVLLDKRLPRWNLLYLWNLKKKLKKFSFTNIIDLQNSSRTSFYRKYLLSKSKWSSTETTLEKDEIKKDFDKDSVLKRFKVQLEKSSLSNLNCLKPDFSWAIKNVDEIINFFFNKKFILIFPFCSPKHPHKKWPHMNKLINIIKSNHEDFEIALAPGPNEVIASKKFDAIIVTNNNVALNIMELGGLINKASYIISNDTGPAHMSAHLGKKGIVLFGHHTTPEKVSIETENFKSLKKKKLIELSPEEVYLKIKEHLSLVN